MIYVTWIHAEGGIKIPLQLEDAAEAAIHVETHVNTTQCFTSAQRSTEHSLTAAEKTISSL